MAERSRNDRLNKRSMDEELGKLLAAAPLSDGPVAECPEPETLAMFSEGKLAGAEADAVIAHLAACSDCYEIVSETMHVREQLAQQQSGRVIFWKQVFHSPARVALLAAVLAVVCFLGILKYTGTTDSPLSRDLVKEISKIHNLPSGSDLAGSAPYGFIESGSSWRAAYQVGVELVRHQAAMEAGNEAAAGMSSRRISDLLRAIDASASTPQDSRRYKEVEDFVADRNLAFHLKFGEWTQLGILGARAKDTSILRIRDVEYFQKSLPADYPQGVSAQLESIRQLLDNKSTDFEKLEFSFGEIVEILE